jgi:hypothetical protein
MPSPAKRDLLGLSRARKQAAVALSYALSLAIPSRARKQAVGLFIATALYAAGPVHYTVIGDEPGPWPKILAPLGLMNGADPGVIIVRTGAAAPVTELRARAEQGAIVVLEGESDAAAAFGFHPTDKRIAVRSVMDVRAPRVEIVWQRALNLPVWQLPAAAQVFAKERWTSAPLMAGLRAGRGGVLWVAVTPGERGYERLPYIPQALTDLGLDPGVRSRRLWAFFDSSYRLRADIEHLAERWQRSGIAALHIAAWHYNEPDPQRDAWLEKLIVACHRRAILVYAWLELPHVSERFWQDHPDWREKTATGQDAHLDWRKLMNLQNRDCREAALRSTRALIERFNWDGVNLGELYFESLEGAANPARFTPFNDDVRRLYKERHGVDAAPADQRFLSFRAELTRDMQQYWIAALDSLRRDLRRDIDVTLTHVDDRFDTRMRDLIGADAARVLPMLEDHDFTFLIEDPATIWHLGPERYTEIASRYAPLARDPEKLAIDINIVERYQDVYPTKQQTGTELFQLVRTASEAFSRVALYFESSISAIDAPLLAAAAAVTTRFERTGRKLVVESRRGLGVTWSGPARVDGLLWPFANAETVWLPPGAHAIEPAEAEPPTRVLHFTGELRSAASSGSAVEFSYESQARALAVLSSVPETVEIDGQKVQPEILPGNVLVLPRGQHFVTLFRTRSAPAVPKPFPN